MSTAKIVLFHQGSTELRRCENCVFFLPVNTLTGVARWLLGPHDTLLCVLIYILGVRIQYVTAKLVTVFLNTDMHFIWHIYVLFEVRSESGTKYSSAFIHHRYNVWISRILGKC